MTILHITGLSSSYEGRPLLKNITFSLEKGEILCLLGPSGSGKTTLLRMLAGLEQPDSGSISFKGSEILNIPPHRRHFGMMFQEYALFPHKNVFDNIIFGLETGKSDKREKQKRVEEMLKVVGLADYGQRRINELSGGEQQRVALARSLAPGPRLLLLDEPLGSLDRTLRDRLAGEIRTILKKMAVTAIFVTHDQSEAFSVADRVAILFDGSLEQFDKPETIYKTPANSTVARFLGFKNIFAATDLADMDFAGPGDCFPPAVTAGACTVLIRPEAARLHTETITQKKEKEPEIIISGTVKSRLFQGATYRVMILSGRHTLHFDLPLEPTPPVAGRNISVKIRHSAIVRMNTEN